MKMKCAGGVAEEDISSRNCETDPDKYKCGQSFIRVHSQVQPGSRSAMDKYTLPGSNSDCGPYDPSGATQKQMEQTE